MILFETYRRSKQETSKREDVAEQIEKLENQVRIFRKAFVELEKETLKTNGTGLSGTRRILPEELYELEEDDGEEGKPKGWRSWFRGIYRQNDPENKTESSKNSSQSKSSEQNATTMKDSKSTGILSRILTSAPKKESMSSVQQAEETINNTPTGTNNVQKQDGLKS